MSVRLSVLGGGGELALARGRDYELGKSLVRNGLVDIYVCTFPPPSPLTGGKIIDPSLSYVYTATFTLRRRSIFWRIELTQRRGLSSDRAPQLWIRWPVVAARTSAHMEGSTTAGAATTAGGTLPIVEDDQNLYDWGIENRLGVHRGRQLL